VRGCAGFAHFAVTLICYSCSIVNFSVMRTKRAGCMLGYKHISRCTDDSASIVAPVSMVRGLRSASTIRLSFHAVPPSADLSLKQQCCCISNYY
jgi:hypothetical protein